MRLSSARYCTIPVTYPWKLKTGAPLSMPLTFNSAKAAPSPFSLRVISAPCQGGSLPAHSGAARLALTTGVPVVPIGIYFRRERAHRLISKFGDRSETGYWYLRGPYAITIGKPMQFDGNVEDRPYVKSISEKIMDAINTLALLSQKRMEKA